MLSVGRVVKGTLVAILGDNFGFVEHFSRADHFCLDLG